MSGLAITAALLVLLPSAATMLTESHINTTDPAVQRLILDEHNKVRRGVEPPATNMLEMIWNDEAAANAQRWADGCNMNHSPASERRTPSCSCGENLFMATHVESWSAAIGAWASEVKNFQYGVGSTGGVVGHYTQMVWYRSNQLGCAVAHCPHLKMKYYYVCHYCPPGNYQLARPYTAGNSCDACGDDCDDKLCTNPCEYYDKYGNCQALKNYYGCFWNIITQSCPASCGCPGKIIN